MIDQPLYEKKKKKNLAKCTATDPIEDRELGLATVERASNIRSVSTIDSRFVQCTWSMPVMTMIWWMELVRDHVQVNTPTRSVSCFEMGMQ